MRHGCSTADIYTARVPSTQLVASRAAMEGAARSESERAIRESVVARAVAVSQFALSTRQRKFSPKETRILVYR